MIKISILVMAFLTPLGADALSWESFRSQYVQKDPQVLKSSEEVQLQKSQSEEFSSFYKTLLILEPNQSQSTYLVASNSFFQRNQYLNASAEQTLKYGSLLKVSLQESLETAELAVNRVDRISSLSWTQNLLGNGFGAADIHRAEAALSLWKAAALKYELSQAKSCMEAFALYLELSSLQTKLLNFETLKKEADFAHSLAKRSYQQKLIRKLDWLAAQRDQLELDTQLQELQASLKNKITDLKKWQMDLSLSQPLTLPKLPDLALLTSPRVGENSSYEEEIAELEVTSNEKSYLATKSDEGSDLKFSLEAGKREGSTPINALISKFEEEYFMASLKWSLPVYDPSRNAKIAQTYSKKIISEEELRRTRLETLAQQQKDLEDLKSLQTQISINEKKKSVLEGQLSEAKRLLSAGRLEFQDYLQYRSQWYNNLTEQLDLTVKLWSAISRQLLSQRNQSHLCKGTDL